MADRLISLFLTGNQVHALRLLGIVKHQTRMCKRKDCGTMFVPTDGRQEFCDAACGKYERQAKWLKAKEKAAKVAAHAAKYSPMHLPDDALIADTKLPTHAKNMAAKAGLVTVGDARAKSDGTLLKTPGLGRLALLELRRL